MRYNNTGSTPIIPMKWVIISTIVFALVIGLLLTQIK